MKTLWTLLIVCLIATTASADDLTWPELARRPELWPTQCTVKETIKFDGGATVLAGQTVNILKFTADEVQVSTKDGRTTFGAAATETDALTVARAAYAKLTPKQRELTYTSLAQKKELWPTQVALTKTLDFSGRRSLRAGDSVTVLDIQPARLSVKAESLHLIFDVAPPATDLMAQARKFVEDDQAGPRFLTAQKEAAAKLKLAQDKLKADGPVVTQLEGKLVNSATGKADPLDTNALPKYLVFYRGSSTCPITRGFTPTLIKYYTETKPKHPEFEIIYVMAEEDADTEKFAKELGFSWPALEYDKTQAVPIVNPVIGSLLPQMIVMDRSGKVLANGFQNEVPATLKKLDALLKVPN
jgi:hypothetical protein